MKLSELQHILDTEFCIKQNEENLCEYAIVDTNKKFFCSDFIQRKTALMTINSENIEIVLTSVFITEEIIQKACKFKNALLITHHNFDYFEDKRGLQPIKPEYFRELQRCNISLYIAHAPLDTHQVYGTSKCLAELCGITIDQYFYDYFGAPTALIGHIKKTSFEEFSEYIQNMLERPVLTLEKKKDYVEKIAVVAGGGDDPDILQQVYDFKCDTYLTGTVEHRWDVPFIQEGNKQFHELNKKLNINLIGGTHYGTERPAMIKLMKYIHNLGLNCKYIEDNTLLDIK